jgi:hypothetical protein
MWYPKVSHYNLPIRPKNPIQKGGITYTKKTLDKEVSSVYPRKNSIASFRCLSLNPDPFPKRHAIQSHHYPLISTPHASMFRRRRPRRRRIPSRVAIRRLRRLHLHPTLLAIVPLVRSTRGTAIVSLVRISVGVVRGVGSGAIRGRGRGVLAAVVGLRVVVVVAWARGPAGAVEGLAAGFAAAAGG